jgi:peptidoglycan/LPS O-acetylase OafA/YrhL
MDISVGKVGAPRARSAHGIGYRADIDGLRAVAVAAVVFFHAFPSLLPGGFIGVDIFFVISGFLISTILLENLRLDRFSFPDFYGRRARRIFPALFIVLAACLALGWVVLVPEEYALLGKHLAGGAGFLSNLLLWQESGYFDTAGETKPLLHLWSLGIEEQFYIVWPAILWVTHKLRLSKLSVIIVIFAPSFLVNIPLAHVYPVANFYSPLTRIWELLIGAAAAQAMFEGRSANPGFFGTISNRLSATHWTAVAGAALIAIALVRLSPASLFPSWRALLPTVGAALLIVSAPTNWINRNVLSQKPMVWLGLISYPLYLWHWPLLAFGRIIQGEALSLEFRCIAVAAAIVLAAGTYAIVERNVLRSPRRLMIAAFSTACMAAIGISGIAIFLDNGAPNRPGVIQGAEIQKQLEGTTWKYTANDACKARYPSDYRYFCVQIGDGSPTMILLGDSFANALVAGLATNPATKNEVILNWGSCEPSAAADSPEIKVQCETQDKIIAATPTLRYAILVAKWPRFDTAGRVVDLFTNVAAYDTPWAPRFRDGLDKRISFLEARGIKVFVFGPKPEIDYDPKYCFSRPFRQTAQSCQMTEINALDQQHELSIALKDVMAKHPAATFFDQDQVFCQNGECSLKSSGGMPMLRDKVHYSQYGSAVAIGMFVKQVQLLGYFKQK